MPRHTLKRNEPTQILIGGRWYSVTLDKIHDHHSADILIEAKQLGIAGLPPRLVPFNEPRRVTK